MEESRRVLKHSQQSPPTSEAREVAEISPRAVDAPGATEERQGAPLDLSRRSPQPLTPPSGLTASTVPWVEPLSPCQAARPPSGPTVTTDDQRPVTEIVSTAPSVSSAFTDPSNLAASPIAAQVTQVTSTKLKKLKLKPDTFFVGKPYQNYGVSHNFTNLQPDISEHASP